MSMTAPDNGTLPGTADADEYEKRIREKVWASECLTAGEWVYLVGLFQMAREHDDAAATRQEPVAWRYQRKEGWGDTWRYWNNPCLGPNEFETPDDWITQPLYDAPAQAVPNRHTIIEAAIRSYCRRQSSAAVQEGRIYYAGLSITDLVNDIEEALSLPSTEGA